MTAVKIVSGRSRAEVLLDLFVIGTATQRAGITQSLITNHQSPNHFFDLDLSINGGHRGASIRAPTTAITTKATPASLVHHPRQASRSHRSALHRDHAEAEAARRRPRLHRCGIHHLVLPTNDETKGPRRRRPLEGSRRRQRVRCSACICLQVARWEGPCMCLVAHL